MESGLKGANFLPQMQNEKIITEKNVLYSSKKLYPKNISYPRMEPDLAYYSNSSSPMKKLLYFPEKAPHACLKKNHTYPWITAD